VDDVVIDYQFHSNTSIHSVCEDDKMDSQTEAQRKEGPKNLAIGGG